MTGDLICADCVAAACHDATVIYAEVGGQLLPITERNVEFVRLWAIVRAGEHPEVPPDLEFIFNDRVRTDCVVIGYLHGRGLCRVCLPYQITHQRQT